MKSFISETALMKKVTILLSIMLFSAGAFAGDCDKKVLKIAQSNLDSKAKASGYKSSDIYQSTLNKVSQDRKSGSAVYSLVGSINKTDYNIRIDMDGSCGLEMFDLTIIK